jgi:hypothetical protein
MMHSILVQEETGVEREEIITASTLFKTPDNKEYIAIAVQSKFSTTHSECSSC